MMKIICFFLGHNFSNWIEYKEPSGDDNSKRVCLRCGFTEIQVYWF